MRSLNPFLTRLMSTMVLSSSVLCVTASSSFADDEKPPAESERTPLRELMQRRPMPAFFSKLDVDGDGKLSKDELEKAGELLAQLDQDGNGLEARELMMPGVIQERTSGFRGEGPQGDRPPAFRPEGDRPRGDRPEGRRPEGGRPPGDRPEGERPDGDRPEGGRGPGRGPGFGGPGFGGGRGGFGGAPWMRDGDGERRGPDGRDGDKKHADRDHAEKKDHEHHDADKKDGDKKEPKKEHAKREHQSRPRPFYAHHGGHGPQGRAHRGGFGGHGFGGHSFGQHSFSRGGSAPHIVIINNYYGGASAGHKGPASHRGLQGPGRPGEHAMGSFGFGGRGFGGQDFREGGFDRGHGPAFGKKPHDAEKSHGDKPKADKEHGDKDHSDKKLHDSDRKDKSPEGKKASLDNQLADELEVILTHFHKN